MLGRLTGPADMQQRQVGNLALELLLLVRAKLLMFLILSIAVRGGVVVGKPFRLSSSSPRKNIQKYPNPGGRVCSPQHSASAVDAQSPQAPTHTDEAHNLSWIMCDTLARWFERLCCRH